ncbi:MAG: Radical SAM superfamily protein [Syntrophus sp. PtaB.Bin001]|nr:MAG: Radical SAM superfamily protein [Syntrophus sp. PtaB.Bin001]
MSLDDLFVSVSKPSRYIGGEVNSTCKDFHACPVRIALAFPDTYEVGMSHLGLQILYAILNGYPDVAAERCYAPWPDMENLLRTRRLPLTTLESRTPLSAFDLVGFSLQYELSYTNVLNMLDLGGIPLHCKDRGESDPLVIAGGPCVFNPAPMAPFMDAFVIGEGEEVISEIAEAMRKAKTGGYNRQRKLEQLAAIPGIYVPALFSGGRIRKRIVTNLDSWRFPMSPIVPLMKTVHDRITLEIARGCTRGCRFCQAGMVWRPVREKNLHSLEQSAEEQLCSTGYDEISLLSLSSGDYSRIEDLLIRLMDRYYSRRIAISLPSLRSETLTRTLIDNIRKVRKTSFTLAPEAGTQRLRNIINKGNTEEDLLATTAQVFSAGWKSVKLYFMIGLPTEKEEDLDGIIDLGHKVLKQTGNKGQVTLSLSTFVPKPHTPFQWHRQIGMEETEEKQLYLRNSIRNRNIGIKWHDRRMSLLEGVFSRGDEALGGLIEKAFRLGCRFDGWSDQFRFDLWEKAMDELNIQTGVYLRERTFQENMPWDIIDCGVNGDFLRNELAKSLSGQLTADCRRGICLQCGVCDHKSIRIEKAASGRDEGITTAHLSRQEISQATDSKVSRLRLTFSKGGTARLLSHLEITEALIRAIKKSGELFVFTEGFHPHPKISFAYATSVGMESDGEYADIQLRNLAIEPAVLMETINSALPAGLRLTEIREISPGTPSLSELIRGFVYEISIPEGIWADDDWVRIEQKADEFLSASSFQMIRNTKNKTVVRDIRSAVEAIIILKESGIIKVSLLLAKEGTVKPIEILTEVLNFDRDNSNMIKIRKVETLFAS